MKAMLVFGAESSATRLWTQILIQYGAQGDGGHEQRFDAGLPEPVAPIVWRRSFPHALEWPDIDGLVRQLSQSGYEPMALVTTRDWTAMAKSQVAAGHVPDETTALANIGRAYQIILRGIWNTCIPYVMVSFEALVQRPQTTITNTLALLGWETPPGFEPPVIEIRDENAKWLI